MKIDIHKIGAAFAVLVLIGAVFWWVNWQRQEQIPVHVEMIDSITYHMNEAQKHADIAKSYVKEVEKYAEAYNDPAIDSVERSRLGAEIRANAIRRADSLRKRAP